MAHPKTPVTQQLLLNFMPHLFRLFSGSRLRGARVETIPTRQSPVQQALYVGFFGSLLYVGGTLPCGRFYYEGVEGFFGNSVLRLSYQYVYVYMGLLAHVSDTLERWYQGLPAWRARVLLGLPVAA